MRETPLPTFANWKDRLVFLLAEFKIPLTLTILAGGVWAVWATPQLPAPPASWLHFSASWVLLAIPAFMVARRFVRWLHSPDYVKVGIALPGTEVVYDGKKVPPKLWENAEVEGPSPLKTDKGWFDYVVTRWEWLDDVGELRVRGCDREEMEPAEAFADAQRVETYFDHHLAVKRAYGSLKARFADLATEVHDNALMQTIRTKDKTLAPTVSAEEQIEQAEEDVGDLPDKPESLQEELRLEAEHSGEPELEDLPGPDLEPGASESVATDGGEP